MKKTTDLAIEIDLRHDVVRSSFGLDSDHKRDMFYQSSHRVACALSKDLPLIEPYVHDKPLSVRMPNSDETFYYWQGEDAKRLKTLLSNDDVTLDDIFNNSAEITEGEYGVLYFPILNAINEMSAKFQYDLAQTQFNISVKIVIHVDDLNDGGRLLDHINNFFYDYFCKVGEYLINDEVTVNIQRIQCFSAAKALMNYVLNYDLGYDYLIFFGFNETFYLTLPESNKECYADKDYTLCVKDLSIVNIMHQIAMVVDRNSSTKLDLLEMRNILNNTNLTVYHSTESQMVQANIFIREALLGFKREIPKIMPFMFKERQGDGNVGIYLTHSMGSIIEKSLEDDLFENPTEGLKVLFEDEWALCKGCCYFKMPHGLKNRKPTIDLRFNRKVKQDSYDLTANDLDRRLAISTNMPEFDEGEIVFNVAEAQGMFDFDERAKHTGGRIEVKPLFGNHVDPEDNELTDEEWERGDYTDDEYDYYEDEDEDFDPQSESNLSIEDLANEYFEED